MTLYHKLTDTIKNICKIIMLEDGGYSQNNGYSRGDWEARGSYGGYNSYRGTSYDDGDYSEVRRGRHYVRGHYSYDQGKQHMMERFKEIMNQASGEERKIIQRCMDMLEKSN